MIVVRVYESIVCKIMKTPWECDVRSFPDIAFVRFVQTGVIPARRIPLLNTSNSHRVVGAWYVRNYYKHYTSTGFGVSLNKNIRTIPSSFLVPRVVDCFRCGSFAGHISAMAGSLAQSDYAANSLDEARMSRGRRWGSRSTRLHTGCVTSGK